MSLLTCLGVSREERENPAVAQATTPAASSHRQPQAQTLSPSPQTVPGPLTWDVSLHQRRYWWPHTLLFPRVQHRNQRVWLQTCEAFPILRKAHKQTPLLPYGPEFLSSEPLPCYLVLEAQSLHQAVVCLSVYQTIVLMTLLMNALPPTVHLSTSLEPLPETFHGHRCRRIAFSQLCEFFFDHKPDGHL